MRPGTCKVADNLGPSWNTLITPVTLRTIVVMVIIVVVLIAVSVLVNTDDGSGNDWKVGTDTYRQAVQAMTPGQSLKKFSDFRKSK